MKNKNLIIWLIVLVIVIILVNLIIFTSKQSNTIKIGAILPLSGIASTWGESTKNGMEIAKEELALEGINLEFIYEDSKADPKEGVSAYQNLKLKGANVIISSFSRVSIPLISLADKDKIPLIMTIVSASAVAEESPYAFRFYADEKSYADAHFKNIKIGDYDTIGLLYLNDDYGISIADHIKVRAKEKNIKIIAEESYNVGTTDYRTELSKIKEKRPDMVMVVDGSPIEAINLLKQYKELGIDAKLYEAATVLSVKSTRDQTSSEGVYTSTFPFFIDEVGLEFKEKYREKYNIEPSFGAPFGYDIVNLIAEVTKGEPLEGEEIIAKIVDLKTLDSLNGELEIKNNGEINPILISTKIVGGELIKVEYEK